MKSSWLYTLLLPLLLVSTFTAAHASEDTGDSKAIDLKLTGELVQQWGTRPSFPESITFAYYHVYNSRALGLEIGQETRQKIEGYIASCQQPDGGFRPKPQHTTTSSVIFTYYALVTLDLLGESEAIDSKAAVDFLRARVQPDGGIVATSGQKDQANLATTYYGIESLRLLGALDRIDKKQVVAFIQHYREKGRGFTRVEGGVSIPQSTFMGVRALQSLGVLTAEVRKDTISYLKSTRYSGLITDRKYALLPNVEAMASMLEALDVLSGLDQVNTRKIYDFIVSLYVEQIGGFGPRPGLGATPASTYQAILSLVRLGKLPDPMNPAHAKRSVAGK